MHAQKMASSGIMLFDCHWHVYQIILWVLRRATLHSHSNSLSSVKNKQFHFSKNEVTFFHWLNFILFENLSCWICKCSRRLYCWNDFFWLFKVQWLHLVEKFVAILCEIFSRFPIPKFIKIASILANYSHNDRVAFFGPQWIWQCFKTNACYYSFTPQKK